MLHKIDEVIYEANPLYRTIDLAYDIKGLSKDLVYLCTAHGNHSEAQNYYNDIRYMENILIDAKSLIPSNEQQRDAGYTHYIWRTVGDDKTRQSHRDNNGKIFSWDDPPPTGHPGEDYNCRCIAVPYTGPVPGEFEDNNGVAEPLYPELVLLGLLHIQSMLL